MRKAFGFEGCPIVLVGRARVKTIEPVRKTKPGIRAKAAPPNRRLDSRFVSNRPKTRKAAQHGQVRRAK